MSLQHFRTLLWNVTTFSPVVVTFYRYIATFLVSTSWYVLENCVCTKDVFPFWKYLLSGSRFHYEILSLLQLSSYTCENKHKSDGLECHQQRDWCSTATLPSQWLKIYDGLFQAFPVLVGDLDASGNLSAQIVHQVAKNLQCKFISQVRSVCYFILIYLRQPSADNLQGHRYHLGYLVLQSHN